jgi:uncharacterized protein (TIGR03435 family)
MPKTNAHELSATKKMTLATIGLAAFAAPVLIGVLNAPAIRAQNARAATPKWEVVSIKPCQLPPQMPGDMYPPRGNSSPGNLRTSCFPLLDAVGMGLIRGAYADMFTPIDGGPSWIHSAFYEINAKAEGNPSVSMMRGPMMQVLLEEHFHLKIHHQTTEGPVYFLRIARGGTKLHRFTGGSCTPYSTPPPPLQPGQEYCRSNISGLSPASVEAQGATLDEFSKLLLPVLHYPVINKTGVTGRFDIRVEFSRDGTQPSTSEPTDPTGFPSIFTAFQEQLGLKLEPGKGPVDSFVIDHIERPAEN